MDQNEIIQVVSALDGVDTVIAGAENGAPEAAWGDTFFSHDPNDGLPANQRFPFATIVTRSYEGFDEASDLNGPDVFRLNIAVGREAYERLIGHPAATHAEHASEFDYTATDRLLPPPGRRAPSRPPTVSYMVAIRQAVPSDIDGIVAVDHAAARPPQDPARLVTTITDPNRLVVVALVDDHISGWGKTHFWSNPDGIAPAGHYLGGLTVAPAHRRLGLGVLLTQARMEWIWQRTQDAWYYTNEQNAASRALHEKWGFEEVARASELHGTSFAGGVGILFRTHRSANAPTATG